MKRKGGKYLLEDLLLARELFAVAVHLCSAFGVGSLEVNSLFQVRVKGLVDSLLQVRVKGFLRESSLLLQCTCVVRSRLVLGTWGSGLGVYLGFI